MITSVTPDEYCKDPMKYANDPTIDNDTRKYWSQLCQAKKSLENQKIPKSISIGQASGEAIKEFCIKMCSPESLFVMSGFVGATQSFRAIKDGFVEWLKNGVSQEILETAKNYVITEGGSEAAANSGLMMDGIWRQMSLAKVVVGEAAEAGYDAGRYGLTALFEGLGFIGELLGEIMMAQMILNLIGSIFDSWDPCNLNTRLTSNTLDEYANVFNTKFRQSMLQNIQSSMDGYGHRVLTANWPIVYYVDQGAFVSMREDYYGPIRVKYYMHYLNTLQFNSLGQPINWTSGNGRVINESDLERLAQELAIELADNNTVVANWLLRYWPILVAIFLLILAVVLFISFRRK